jgi:hypothetical protein
MTEPARLVSLDRIFTGKGRPYVEARTAIVELDGSVSLYSLFSGYLDPPHRRAYSFEKQEIVHKYVKSGAALNWIQGIWVNGTFEWDKIGWETADLLIKMYEFETTKLGATGSGNELLLYIHNDDPIPLSITLDGALSFPYLRDKHVGHSASISWNGMIRLPYTDLSGEVIDIEDLFTDDNLTW